MTIDDLLIRARKMGASDVHVTVLKTPVRWMLI